MRMRCSPSFNASLLCQFGKPLPSPRLTSFLQNVSQVILNTSTPAYTGTKVEFPVLHMAENFTFQLEGSANLFSDTFPEFALPLAEMLAEMSNSMPNAKIGCEIHLFLLC